MGEPYEVAPSETSTAAGALAAAGDPGRRRRPHGRGAARPSRIALQPRLLQALAGRREAALEHLRAAASSRPGVRRWAASDEDLDSLRDDPGFPA